MNLTNYDKVIIAFSGGKDSTACFLKVLESGIPVSKIELWHHLVDGIGKPVFDWPVTLSYCQAFAAHFGVPMPFSYKHGGFLKEINRRNEQTQPIFHQDNTGKIYKNGGGGKFSTRLKFPQQSADLSVRWCSAYLKIDVMDIALRNQERFRGIKTIIITGERGEESTARSRYKHFEPHRADLRHGKKFQRHIDHWRPILHWQEREVWEIIEKHRVRVHPAYYLGFSRVSCLFCIFGNADQFTSAYQVAPGQGDKIIQMEKDFAHTMDRKYSIPEKISQGTVYTGTENDLEAVAVARSHNYTLPIICDNWNLPSGAYGKSCGPS